MKTRSSKVRVKYCNNPTQVKNIKNYSDKSIGLASMIMSKNSTRNKPSLEDDQLKNLKISKKRTKIRQSLRSRAKHNVDLREILDTKRKYIPSDVQTFEPKTRSSINKNANVSNRIGAGLARKSEGGGLKRGVRKVRVTNEISKQQILRGKKRQTPSLVKNSKTNFQRCGNDTSKEEDHSNDNHPIKPSNEKTLRKLLNDISQGNGIFDKKLTGNEVSDMLMQNQPKSSIVALPGKLQVALKGNLQVDLKGRLTVNLFADLQNTN